MGPCSSKSKATIPLGLGKAGGFCPTAVVGKSKGLFGGEPGVGLSRELPCSCLRELAILSLEEAEYVEEGSSDPMIVEWETPQVEEAGVATTVSHLRPLHLSLSVWPRSGPSASTSFPLFFFAVSEGRRDQCEAPSDPKFPDCSGKVEVRPRAPP